MICTLSASVFLPAEAATTNTFVLADVQKPEHPVVQATQFMSKRLAETSSGEINIQIKPNGELGDESSVVEKLRKGQLDMARVNLGILADTVPAAKILSLPYLFRSRDHMWGVLRGDFGQQMERQINQSGLVVLTYFDSGVRSFYSVKKPLRSRSDFAGMRIRIQPSPVYQDLITQLGGVPVVMAYDKVLDALKNGEIDGAENNIPSYVSTDHYKYAKYLTLDEHSTVPEVLLMSQKAWKSLSPRQQVLLKQSAAEASDYMAKLWAEKEQGALAVAKKSGVIIIPKSALAMTGIESAAVQLYSKYAKTDDDLDTVLKIVSSK
jgi:tripartite ATP-independent transporter DctP family solute receptor